jgi:hypothetical protein
MECLYSIFYLYNNARGRNVYRFVCAGGYLICLTGFEGGGFWLKGLKRFKGLKELKRWLKQTPS